MVDCFALDEISSQLEEKRANNEKDEILPTGSSNMPASVWDADKLIMIGVVAVLVILSFAVLVYVARH